LTSFEAKHKKNMRMVFKLWMSLVLISLIIPINTALSVGDVKSALYRRLVDVLTGTIKRGGLGSGVTCEEHKQLGQAFEDKMVYNIADIKECIQLCSDETDFICLSIDYFKLYMECSLSSNNKFTQPQPGLYDKTYNVEYCTVRQAACPDGFTALSNRCYSIEGAKSTQADARTTCNAKGAQLAILNTKELFDEVHTWLTTLEPMPRVSLWVDAQCSGEWSKWSNSGEWLNVGECPDDFHWNNGDKISDSEWRWDDGPRDRVDDNPPPDGVAMYHRDNFLLDNRPSTYNTAKALCQIGGSQSKLPK